ncbi:MAG TPA: PH domain-containing protein [Nitrososphaeraceae archaeon]|nr:PH domain-containing protein [Nitrososphaeraceae archaeon]
MPDKDKFDIKEIEEIKKISKRLDSDEKVEIVAKQSKLRPGGSHTTPDTIFVTNKRILIRDPSFFGAREDFESITYDKITSIELEKCMFSSAVKIMASGYRGDIDAISKEKAEKIVEYIKRSMENIKKQKTTEVHTGIHSDQKLSIADELFKLAKLKEQGIINEAEFLKMKQDILKM